jgi:MFS family permease
VTVANGIDAPPVDDSTSALAVFRIRPFLLLWLSQAATQIGGNMVIYGLTVVIFDTTHSSAVVSALLLTFLVPAVLLSAVAGVYVDRLDRRLLLVVTNVLRAIAFAVLFLVGTNVPLILLLNVLVSCVTVFFAPAEAAMIPVLVPRQLLLAANGLFTLTLNAAFAVGFALLGPLVVTIAGPEALILIVGVLYLVAAGFCFTLPAVPPLTSANPEDHQSRMDAVAEAERAVESTLAQLREGLDYIRAHHDIAWSLIYLGVTASLIGVLGVLGPAFATAALGLSTKDFVVVVLPLGLGVVFGILALNSYGRYLPRRRVIETGMIMLGLLLGLLTLAGPIARLLEQGAASSPSLSSLSGLASLLSVVVIIAFLAGVSYAVVAIPAQTQLQEDLPEEVRGRVFGVLNMLVSVASFLPIIIVGSIADVIGVPAVIVIIAVLVVFAGTASVVMRGPLRAIEASTRAEPGPRKPVDPVSVALQADTFGDVESARRRRPRSRMSEPVAVRPAGPSIAVGEPEIIPPEDDPPT